MEQQQRQALGDITQAVMNLLDSWQLDTQEIQGVLSLPEGVRARALNKLREGTDVLPDNPEVLRRAGYLLRIADALRTTYPLNPRMSGRWVRQGHRRFGRRSPLSIILRDGESGMIAVLSELDCTFSWDLTGSTGMGYRPVPR
ncbi:MAG: DUF2384 domain-containing protein [Chromatiaceae bacterium]|nr:DUF2384 domain-containing protein [Gammaproteobacteria bacterium]MCP5300031.1 DUF2384 domain-containing protein [Chromatiaceae bacterium]MCP5422103.1 DUF2384 domain-containing protein [Chromatiaceae bacterium]